MTVRIRTDPRANKGLCSTCQNLSVRQSDTGDEEALCILFRADHPFVRTIGPKITECTDHAKLIGGSNYSSLDAWYGNVGPDGRFVFSKGTVRFVGGQYERQVLREGRYEWEVIK